MRQVGRRLVFALITAIAGGVGGFSPSLAEDAVTQLNVVSQPQGARVFVDDVEVGRSPIEVMSLKPGDHRVRLLLDGYLENSRNVLVVPDETTRLVVNLTPMGSRTPASAVTNERDEREGGGRKKWVLIGAGVVAAGAGAFVVRGTNQAPTLGSLAVTPSDVTGIASVSPFLFSASDYSDPDGDHLQFTWSFGDGEVGTLAQMTHVYGRPGTFTPSLKVSDGKKSVTKSATPVTVRDVSGTWRGTTKDGDSVVLRLLQNGTVLSGTVTYNWNGTYCRTDGETIESSNLGQPRTMSVRLFIPTYCGGRFWGDYQVSYACNLDSSATSCQGTMSYYNYVTPVTLTRE